MCVRAIVKVDLPTNDDRRGFGHPDAAVEGASPTAGVPDGWMARMLIGQPQPKPPHTHNAAHKLDRKKADGNGAHFPAYLAYLEMGNRPNRKDEGSSLRLWAEP